MIRSAVEGVGGAAIRLGEPLVEMSGILGRTLQSAATLSFINPAVFRALIRQTYETGVRSLPGTLVAALVLGSITVHYILSILTGLGAYDRIGAYLVTAMLHEAAPVTVTLLLMLRSGNRVIAEVALMRIHRELDALSAQGIRVRDYVFLPRVLAFAVAGPGLSLIFALAGLLGGFFILGTLQDITFESYIEELVLAIEPESLVLLVVKPLVMGVAVAVTSIRSGLAVRRSFVEVPGRLIQGTMTTLAVIFLLEVVFVVLT
jgi:phospholipid/cholesterol/gamma-HCH transport system permease protein